MCTVFRCLLCKCKINQTKNTALCEVSLLFVALFYLRMLLSATCNRYFNYSYGNMRWKPTELSEWKKNWEKHVAHIKNRICSYYLASWPLFRKNIRIRNLRAITCLYFFYQLFNGLRIIERFIYIEVVVVVAVVVFPRENNLYASEVIVLWDAFNVICYELVCTKCAVAIVRCAFVCAAILFILFSLEKPALFP